MLAERCKLLTAEVAEIRRQGMPVQFGKKLKEIRVGGEHPVTACFADGTEANGDFLVGCDGTHSRTRQLIFPDAPKPSYTGMLSCGGILQYAAAPRGGVASILFDFLPFSPPGTHQVPVPA